MNLISLIDAKNNLNPDIFKEYKNSIGINIKNYELQSIEKMIRNFSEIIRESSYLVKHLDQFSIGYVIKQIGKEFDLLRLGENYNINIELKSEFTSIDKIKKQLLKNEYYLSPLRNPTHSLTYIEDQNKFVCLYDNSLIDIEFNEVLDLIYNQRVKSDTNTNRNFDEIFDPSFYLVSPFNSTDEFINGKCFLTAQQENIKKEILEKYINESFKISIKGAPGTGKTLLIYDLAKEQRYEGKKVLIIHCGILNSGHHKLISKFDWEICSIRNYSSYINKDLDLIIIDESQRIESIQFYLLLEIANRENITCIFSHDGSQCLHDKEINRQMATNIINVSNVSYSLKEKVRSNKEMARFIKYIFDKKTVDSNVTNFEDIVHIKYFKNMEMAKKYTELLISDNWKFINFTNSLRTYDPFDNSIIDSIDDNAHKVVGQEYDKVGVIIDHNFYYEDGRLRGTKQSYYHSTKMLFQILTRAKKQLYLIIVNNENMLVNLLEILHSYSKRKLIHS